MKVLSNSDRKHCKKKKKRGKPKSPKSENFIESPSTTISEAIFACSKEEV